MRRRRLSAAPLAAATLLAGLLTGCASPARPALGRAALPAALGSGLTRTDLEWLSRVGFGADSAELADFRSLGRSAFLEQQLHPPATVLPPAVAARIEAMPISHLDVVATLAMLRDRQRALRTLPDPSARQRARAALNAQGNELAREAAERTVLRAVYDPAQLREQMTWFWLNHFNVAAGKAEVRWLAADYVDDAIGPHALGKFRDLVMATLEHPAMLEYLDNAQNRRGHINENYARELMELHTLGVGSGYTQQDVQTVARVLTGVGINPGFPPRLAPALRRFYVRRGAFQFNPAQHDFGAKTLLGRRLRGQGFAEVQEAVTVLVRQPACAQFISRELATYFVADDPPPALVAAMTRTFRRTDGDIAAVLRTMFESPEMQGELGGKFKDPMRFLVSALRLTLDGRALEDPKPLLGWLAALGEAPYAHVAPDGYPLTESGWASAGQLMRRFDIAQAIGAGRLLSGALPPGPPLPNELSRSLLEPWLSNRTRATLAQAQGPAQWSALLLSSPEFNYE